MADPSEELEVGHRINILRHWLAVFSPIHTWLTSVSSFPHPWPTTKVVHLGKCVTDTEKDVNDDSQDVDSYEWG